MDDDELEKKMRSAERASPHRYLDISIIGSFCSALLVFGVAGLLAHGADPNAEGHNGETALSFARETGDGSFIEVLIANGAVK